MNLATLWTAAGMHLILSVKVLGMRTYASDDSTMRSQRTARERVKEQGYGTQAHYTHLSQSSCAVTPRARLATTAKHTTHAQELVIALLFDLGDVWLCVVYRFSGLDDSKFLEHFFFVVLF